MKKPRIREGLMAVKLIETLLSKVVTGNEMDRTELATKTIAYEMFGER